MSDAERLAVWDSLAGRLDQLAVAARLLPWTREELARWVSSTLTEGRGTWVTGVPGAVAEFPAGPTRALEVSATAEAIEARADDARFRLRLHDKLRAFAFSGTGRIVLGFPKARAALAVAQTLTALGPDTDAIDPRHRAHELFDFGIGRRSSRFCVRTEDAELRAALTGLAGRSWSHVLQEAGPLVLRTSPHRIVESMLARIEVFARIPAPGGTSPDGAHTHFLPSFLQSGDEAPAGLALPDYALPVAIYYPRDDEGPDREPSCRARTARRP